MKPRIWVKEIKFSEGLSIELEKDEIILFVGPNNVGKSVSLKEINGKISNRKMKSIIVSDVELNKEGEEKDLLEHIKSSAIVNDQSNPTNPTLQTFKLSNQQSQISNSWTNHKNGISILQGYFSNFLTTTGRLVAVNPPNSISFIGQAPTHPIHFLQRDDKLEIQFSKYFNQAFETDLIVNRGAGSRVPIHIGKRPTPSGDEDRISLSYVKKIEELPKLHEQGDGMKSFVGVLLNSFISQYSIVLVDEPEAFLHPPQARLLGKMIGKELPYDRQLFLASHSGDFLRGILDSGSQKVRIIRIDRIADRNKICELKPTEINELWKDPLLRHSNVLDGIFHKKVIICESDSDCRFYSAILQAVVEKNSLSSPDFMFIHCGGKHRIPQVVGALKKLNVDISVICDFDVLNNVNPLGKIVENLGGNWNALKPQWKIVKNAIDKKRPELETEDVKKEINEILNNISDRIFPKAEAKKINSALKKISAWNYAKQVGSSFIPSGDPTSNFQNINKEFKKINLFIVEVGELEGFCRSIGNHGPKWVNEVLEKELKNETELQNARNFIKEIIENNA